MTGKRIFICYRRGDEEDLVGRLYDRLSSDFRDGRIFMDIDDMPLGVDFRAHIRQELANCDYVFAIIGPQWVQSLNERATQANDFVRVELEIAHELSIPIAPILLKGATHPQPADLPASFPLRDTLPYLASRPLRGGADFSGDYQKILAALNKSLPHQISESSAEQKSSDSLEPGREFSDKLAYGGESPAMIVIPAGEFEMGSPASEPDRLETEEPVHRVTIGRFALGKFPVTFEAFDKFTHATNRRRNPDEGWGRGERPAINVSWQNAMAYCEWLSAETGYLYRLPTEAEWEYAARAMSNTPYWWGEDITHEGKIMLNCAGSGNREGGVKTTPVGRFPANPFGLYDMHGNVWEWTADCWHQNYIDAPQDGRAWRESNAGDCDRAVVRGGAWGNGPRNARSAVRNWSNTDVAYDDVGFRLARTL